MLKLTILIFANIAFVGLAHAIRKPSKYDCANLLAKIGFSVTPEEYNSAAERMGINVVPPDLESYGRNHQLIDGTTDEEFKRTIRRRDESPFPTDLAELKAATSLNSPLAAELKSLDQTLTGLQAKMATKAKAYGLEKYGEHPEDYEQLRDRENTTMFAYSHAAAHMAGMILARLQAEGVVVFSADRLLFGSNIFVTDYVIKTTAPEIAELVDRRAIMLKTGIHFWQRHQELP